MLSRNPLAQMEEEKRDHDAKMKKMETEMEQVFEMKVKEKKQKLRDSEADVSTCLSLVTVIFFQLYFLIVYFVSFPINSFNVATSKCENLLSSS